MNKNLIVISLGGSMVVPAEGRVDHLFLKKFKKIILEQVKKGKKFIIVVGGGKTARVYQSAARQVGELVPEDIDWIGIHSTRLNAHLLRTIFRQVAEPQINKNPEVIIKMYQPILIGAGWRPGFSTDFDAVELAIGYRATEVINISNVDYVYDRDPKKYPQAKKLTQVSWADFLKLVGQKWTPGANWPFDPVASRLAKKNHLRVVMLGGKNLDYLANYLNFGKIRGTLIS